MKALKLPPTTPPATADAPKGPFLPRLKVLWEFVRPHRRTLLLGLVLGLGTTAAALATPMVTKWVLDTLGTGESLTPAVLTLVGLLVVGLVLGLWQWVLLGTLAERVVLDARSSMVRRYFRARIGALTGRPTGELVTRVTSDTVLLREAASSSIVNLVNFAVSLVGTIVAGGGTTIYPALKTAFDRLAAYDAPLKHIILLSDGQSNEGDYGGLVAACREQKITLSTVAVGADADLRLMQFLAQGGGGRFYVSEDVGSLPRIFTKEAFLASLDQVLLRDLVSDPPDPVLLSLALPAPAGAPPEPEKGP